MREKQKLYLIVGPTASGKTAASLEVAKRINAEVISADSIQVYRGMDIGSAKIRPEEMQHVPHYLVDGGTRGNTAPHAQRCCTE